MVSDFINALGVRNDAVLTNIKSKKINNKHTLFYLYSNCQTEMTTSCGRRLQNVIFGTQKIKLKRAGKGEFHPMNKS